MPSAAPTTTETLTIRRASWEDMETIAGFIRSTAEWYRPFVAPEDMREHLVDEEWQRVNFARREFYVGEVEGEAIGTISLQTFGEFAYVGYVYLDADRVGHGYGRRLLRFAADTARRRGLQAVTLIAHPQATWATKAYRKFGFERRARARAEVLAWNGGVLAPYYEEGFELYVYPLV